MNQQGEKRHIISVLLENEAGALARVSGLFSARGFNIETLTVAPTEDPTLSRMTIVTVGSDTIIEQIKKQLNKLVEVFKLMELTKQDKFIEREMMLVKVHAVGEQCGELVNLVEVHKGRIVEVIESVFTIEVMEEGERLDAFLGNLGKMNILEVARSGVIGLASGKTALNSSKSAQPSKAN